MDPEKLRKATGMKHPTPDTLGGIEAPQQPAFQKPTEVNDFTMVARKLKDEGSFKKEIAAMTQEEASSFIKRCGRDGVDLLVLKLDAESLADLLQKAPINSIAGIMEEMGEEEIKKINEKIQQSSLVNSATPSEIQEVLHKRTEAQKEFRVIEKQDEESFLQVLLVGNLDELAGLVENVNALQRRSFLEKIDSVIRARGFLPQSALPSLDKNRISDLIKGRIEFIRKLQIAETEGVVVGSEKPEDQGHTSFIIPLRTEVGEALGEFLKSQGMEFIPPLDMNDNPTWIRVQYELIKEHWSEKKAKEIIGDAMQKLR